MQQRHKLVMLPTKAASNILMLNYYNNPPELTYRSIPTNTTVFVNNTPQHLYVLSDEKIKKGDWFYDGTNIRYLDIEPLEGFFVAADKKIIASTDPSLWTTTIRLNASMKDFNTRTVPTGMAKIGQPFIEKFIKAYNAGKPITEIMVEYESIQVRDEGGITVTCICGIGKGFSTGDRCRSCGSYHEVRTLPTIEKLKLHRDGSIITHAVEQSIFTDEMRQIVRNYALDVAYAAQHGESVPYFDKWLEIQ